MLLYYKKKGQNEQNWCSNDVWPSKQTVYHSKKCKAVDNTVLTTLEVTTYRWLSKPYHTLECILFYHLYIVTLYWYVYNICAIVIILRCGTRREQIYMYIVYKYIFFVFCLHVSTLSCYCYYYYYYAIIKEIQEIYYYIIRVYASKKNIIVIITEQNVFFYLCHFFKHFFFTRWMVLFKTVY